MPWYYRARKAINTAMPFLAPTQQTNLALLVSAIIKKQTLCLSELARAYPVPDERRVPAPKHCLLYRLKRLWRFTNNERVDSHEVQLALVPHTIARLGCPHLLGLAIDWTMFDTTLPSGERRRYQVLRIAVLKFLRQHGSSWLSMKRFGMLEGGTTIERIAEVAHVGLSNCPVRSQAAAPDRRSCRGERYHPFSTNLNQRSSLSDVLKALCKSPLSVHEDAS